MANDSDSGLDIERILTTRGTVYGDFVEMAQVAQCLKETLQVAPGWATLPGYAREALDMFATKISRIVIGDYRHVDSWADIAGYATRVVQELNRGKTNE